MKRTRSASKASAEGAEKKKVPPRVLISQYLTLVVRTPALIVDKQKLFANANRMIKIAAERKVSLRPHIKTHKTLEGAYYQLYGAPTPGDPKILKVVASTLGEARFFISHGFEDVLYGIAIVASKFAECAALTKKATLFSVMLDSMATFHQLAAYAQEQGAVFNVFLDVDPGYHRSGLDPTSAEGLLLAKTVIDSPHVNFRGIYTHAGHSYHSHNADEICKYAEAERDVISGFAERLRAELGYQKAFIVSMGSTPTCSHLPLDMKAITEIHPGNYIFYDRSQALMGSCSFSDCAASVLATIIGHYPATGRMLIDAGALALSKDLGCTHIPGTTGWGSVMDGESLRLVAITQELGNIEAAPGTTIDMRKYPVGSQIRIIPNHSCLTAACFEEYFVVDEQQMVVEIWRTIPREW